MSASGGVNNKTKNMKKPGDLASLDVDGINANSDNPLVSVGGIENESSKHDVIRVGSDAIVVTESPDGDGLGAFLENIKSDSYRVQEEPDNDSFIVYKKEKNGEEVKEVEVLRGDKNTCIIKKFDENIINAFIDAHKGQTVIVNQCGSREDAEHLIKLCNDKNVPIKFAPEILKNLGVDALKAAKYSLDPSEQKNPTSSHQDKTRKLGM